MSFDHISKSKHWMERAAEMRTIAAPMAEDGIKASMLELANNYDKFAARAIARDNAVRPKGDVPSTAPSKSRGCCYRCLAVGVDSKPVAFIVVSFLSVT
jgi:hypothetical protein